jgi:hypothetical protein
LRGIGSAYGCGFNRQMRRLSSSCLEKDVEHEIPTEDLLHRDGQISDVGANGIDAGNGILWALSF